MLQRCPYYLQLFSASDGGFRDPILPQGAPNKTQRVKCCQDLLKLLQDHGEDFLGSHLLVQDESWFYWDLAERRQVWADPTGAREEDDDSDGVHLQAEGVSITALPAGTTADRNTMIEYLRTTGKRFLSLKKDKIRLKCCLLMWTMHFLTRRDVEPVKQSPYSLNLNLFEALLREDEFGDHEEATLAVQRAMRRVSEDELYDQLRKLWDTATTSLQSEGIMCTD
ncbi:Uncharacterized protein FKW44_022436 [Caligus rogercresseyi]|uniref:Uncharacterized protein n=1 Tax=Caligus rogercresseyi TaxID=217165 RepID=A0A7T8GN53_CALRO|nr:Uncharacterized protein FKW44_022436 [Caligus rogercresseyi]